MTRGFEFFGYLWRLTGGRIGIALSLNILSSLTEGISLFLLIPLIGIIEAQRAGGIDTDIPILGDLLRSWNPELEAVLLLFVGLIVLQAGFTRIRTLYLTRIMHRALDTIRQDFFDRLGAARWDAIQQTRVSDLNFMMTTEAGRIQVAAGSLTQLFQAAIMLTVYVFLSALVSWQMALFAVAIGTLLLVLLYPIRRRATQFGQDLSGLHSAQNQTLIEFLTGLRVAKSFVAERGYGERFERRLANVRGSVLRFVGLSSLGTMAFQIASAVAAAAFIWVAVEVVALELAELIVLLLIFIRLAPRFGMIQDSLQGLLSNLHAYENIRRATHHFASAVEAAEEEAPAPDFRREIRLEGVTLTYAKAAHPGGRNRRSDDPGRQDHRADRPVGQRQEHDRRPGHGPAATRCGARAGRRYRADRRQPAQLARDGRLRPAGGVPAARHGRRQSAHRPAGRRSGPHVAGA